MTQNPRENPDAEARADCPTERRGFGNSGEGPAAVLRACRTRSKAFPQFGFSKRQVKHSAGLPNRSIATKKRRSCRRTEDVADLSGPWSGIVRSRAVPRGAAAGIPPQTVESLLVFRVKRLYAHACSAAGVRPMLCPPSALVRAYGAGSRWHSVWFAQFASSVSREMLVRVERGRGNAVR